MEIRRGARAASHGVRRTIPFRMVRMNWAVISITAGSSRWMAATLFPDFLSLSAALPLCARFLLYECRVSDSCSGALPGDGEAIGSRRSSGAGVLSPLPGLGVHVGTEPSAHALGYRLTALRAWGLGLEQGWWSGFVSLVSFMGGISTLEPQPSCGARGCFNPSGVVSVSRVNPGCASRPRAICCNPSGIVGKGRRFSSESIPIPSRTHWRNAGPAQ